MGRPRPISRPWSRTGENPPYGILGGTMETSASFEARSAPSSYPTASQSRQATAYAHVVSRASAPDYKRGITDSPRARIACSAFSCDGPPG